MQAEDSASCSGFFFAIVIFLKASQGQMIAAKFSIDLVNFLLLKTVFFHPSFIFSLCLLCST